MAAFLPALLILVYSFWPGDPAGLISGWPWRERGGLLVTMLLLAVFIQVASPLSRSRAWVCTALLVALAGRIVLAPSLVPEGWASEVVVRLPDGAEPAQRIGRRTSDGRVIDRRPQLSSRSPALQFLNEHPVPPGGPEAVRNATFDVHWQAYLWLSSDDSVRVRGLDRAVDVTIDGEPIDLRLAEAIPLAAGAHDVRVLYQKLAGEYPNVSVEIESSAGRSVRAYAEPPARERVARQGWLRRALMALDGVVVGAGIVWVWPQVVALASASRRRETRVRAVLQSNVFIVALPLVVFTVYGLHAAGGRADATLFLIGDDMRQYAADGRDIALHGLLMNHGRPPFTGIPFHQYPLYPYFVAATHLLFDESVYGLFFLQFVLLGVTFGVLVWLTRGLFGVGTAWLAAGMLCGLGLMNFSRYYTVSVFTDNLYYPLVAAGVAALWQAGRSGTWQAGATAGLLGGLATLTRPSMLFVLPLAVAWLVWLHLERKVRGRHVTAAVVATAWMATVGLATLRNWLASGQFVLIADSSLQILVFLAPPGVDYADYMVGRRPSVLQSVAGAWRIFVDYPLEVLLVQARKLAFMVGFTNIQPSYRLQPGFLLLSAGYGAWWALRGRQVEGSAAVHLTLLGHVVAFLVASPMTYGYKTILTLMMLVVPFTASLAWDGICRAGARFGWNDPGPQAV